MEQHNGLCYRCEHRAEYFEAGRALRYECGMTSLAVHSCYAYEPVKPLTIIKQKGDQRPFLAGIIACRAVRASKQFPLVVDIKRFSKKKILPYWRPIKET